VTARAVSLLAIGLVAVTASSAGGAATPFRLTSPAFPAGGTIPTRYTCLGDNVSPALRWTAPPARTRSFALEVHDPDAPRAGGFTHWLAWGFRASARGLGVDKRAPIEGAGDSGAFGYTGPVPAERRPPLPLHALRALSTAPARPGSQPRSVPARVAWESARAGTARGALRDLTGRHSPSHRAGRAAPG
jgi:Raf kinase inhibitor-like YbhB/YbcL family protein